MRKTNPIIVMGAVLAVAGVAVLVALASRGGGTSSGKSVDVLVASAPVAAGTAAAAAPLAVKSLPVSAVPEGALTSAAAVSGQVALHPLAKGEVVVPGTFGQTGVAVAGGVVLPKGMEGIGVELGFVPGGLRYVVPGNRITVWAAAKGGSARVLLQSVQVIATTPGTGTGAATAITAGPGVLDFLLAVTTEQAAKIISAQTSGATMYFTLASTGSKA